MSLYTPSKIDRYTLGSATEMNADRGKVKSAFDAIEALVNSIAEGGGILNYTWVAYADSGDGTSNFTTSAQEGRQYMGLAFNRPSATPSSNPSDYNWYLFAPGSGLFQSLLDGTAAAPGLAFLNDKDTGIRRISPNALAIVTGGVDRIIINADGTVNVGDMTAAGERVPIQGFIGNGDLNTVVRSGMYRFEQPVNGPAGWGWGQLLVVHGPSDQVAQIAWDRYTGRMASRIGQPTAVGGNGWWSPWRYAVDTDLLAAASCDINGATMRRNGQHLYGPDNNPGFITSNGRAYPRWTDGGNLGFSPDTRGGTPGWIFGGEYGEDTARLYSPLNFSVSYANTAGRARGLKADGQAWNLIWAGQGAAPGHLLGSNNGVDFYAYSPGLLSVDNADKLDGRHASDFPLLSAFESGANANGYWYKIPTASGAHIIRQRGRRSSGWSAYTGEHQETVYFPVPYQWGESVFVTFGQHGNDSNSDGYVQLKAVYADRFVIQHQHPSSGNLNYGWDWMAEGE